jgi:hypothetical protein
VAARKKKARKKRKRAAVAAPPLVVRVAEQMAGVVEKGLDRMREKLPTRARTAEAARKLKDAVGALRRQAVAIRDQAQDLEAKGALEPAAIWRRLAEKVDGAIAELQRRAK